jgi:hypothetical protein
MSRRRLIATAALVLALAGSAACAQPTGGVPAQAAQAAPAPATRPPLAGDNNAAFCAALGDARNALFQEQLAITGESDADQLKLIGDMWEQLIPLAPPEIASDLQTVADGFHAGGAGAASDEADQRIGEAIVRVVQELPRICS